ncbi:isoprenoid synthase domain-containing protein [Penicillium angulare]|uniref:Isoprenoid synthase domain-containing protein n=1 Tax=Penicillium angulare TaxID=116970 RepID=A0A9W9KJR0_9EURO|nr:isoprenoid synthase domain-containing protein [Penicillium angulare]
MQLTSAKLKPVLANKFTNYLDFLLIFIDDEAAQRTPFLDWITMADMAKRELADVKDRALRFAIYMNCLSSERRIQLILEMQTPTLMIDEAYEIHSNSHAHKMLSNRIASGNGGGQYIELIKGSVDYPSPSKFKDRYENFEEFMDFRHMDGGMGLVAMCWTLTNFAIGSGANYEDPRFKRFLRLLRDHILISNDIASFDKELKDYKNGKFFNFVKTQGVMILKDLLALPTIDAAKSVLYAYQLEYGKLIDAKLEKLQSKCLTDDEWYLLDAYVIATTGNVMEAATMTRVPVFNSSYFEPDQ